MKRTNTNALADRMDSTVLLRRQADIKQAPYPEAAAATAASCSATAFSTSLMLKPRSSSNFTLRVENESYG